MIKDKENIPENKAKFRMIEAKFRMIEAKFKIKDDIDNDNDDKSKEEMKSEE